MNDNVLTDVETLGGLFNLSKILLLIFGTGFLWLVNYVAGLLFQSLMTTFPTYRFSIFQLKTLFSFILYIAGSLALLVSVINPPREVLIATAGSLALAMGFALKDIAASIIAGLVLLFDRPFVVGDRVTFGGVYGELVAIGLRSVRLRTLDDNIVTIPNSRFMSEMTASGNTGALDMMVVTVFHIALQADIKAAAAMIHEVIVTSRFVYLKKPVTFVFEEVEVARQLAIRIHAKAYVLDVVYEKDFQSDVVLRVTEIFTKNNVLRPKLLPINED